MDDYKFMDWADITLFTVAVQQLRDEAKNYFETNLTAFYPNLYTKKYCEVISKLNDLAKALSVEVAERAAQLGREEKARIPHKFKQATKKKRRRRKTKYVKKIIKLCAKEEPNGN